MSVILRYESSAKEASLSTAAGDSTDHGLPRGFQRQLGTLTSTSSLGAAQIVDINMEYPPCFVLEWWLVLYAVFFYMYNFVVELRSVSSE